MCAHYYVNTVQLSHVESYAHSALTAFFLCVCVCNDLCVYVCFSEEGWFLVFVLSP